MSIDAMKQALEALEEVNKLSIGENAICLPAEIDGAMDALRAAIEQAQQELVCVCGAIWEGQELVSSPPPRKPLPPQSPCEMTQAERRMFKLGWLECEAAHGIKGEI